MPRNGAVVVEAMGTRCGRAGCASASRQSSRLPTAHPHPHAGGAATDRGRRAREQAGGVGRGMRVMAPKPADFAHLEVVVRRTRATGVQAARLHSKRT
jgi:hypothetical protein